MWWLTDARRAASCRRRRLAREDLRQTVDVEVVEHAAPAGRLEPRDQLGLQDVDLAVQDAALVADLLLFGLQIVDQLLELLVREGAEIREKFHLTLSFAAVDYSGEAANRQPQLEDF